MFFIEVTGKTVYHGLYDQLYCDQPKSSNYAANIFVSFFFYLGITEEVILYPGQAVLNIHIAINFTNHILNTQKGHGNFGNFTDCI